MKVDQIVFDELQASRSLSVAAYRVRQMARDGRIPHFTLPDGSVRFLPRDLQLWVSELDATLVEQFLQWQLDSERQRLSVEKNRQALLWLLKQLRHDPPLPDYVDGQRPTEQEEADGLPQPGRARLGRGWAAPPPRGLRFIAWGVARGPEAGVRWGYFCTGCKC